MHRCGNARHKLHFVMMPDTSTTNIIYCCSKMVSRLGGDNNVTADDAGLSCQHCDEELDIYQIAFQEQALSR